MLEDDIEALRKAATTPARQRRERTSAVVDRIAASALESGLDGSSLSEIISVISHRSELDQTSITTLAKNLYPSEKVSSHVVIGIVNSLGQGQNKPSTATQLALVKWLIIVLEVLEDRAVLSRLYGVLFNLLDMISLRASLCHLLALITRRRHVRPYRIQQLLDLLSNVGNEPALVGLLRVYKDYYPDIIVGSAGPVKGSLPPLPSEEWRQRLNRIHEAGLLNSGDPRSSFNGFKVLRQGGGRGQNSILPEVHTFHATASTVTIEEINNVHDFIAKLERIELPNQLISCLQDPLLRKFLMLKPASVASERINFWLSAYLNEELQSLRESAKSSPHLSEMLHNLLDYTRYAKTLLPTLDMFLRAYIALWDGQSNVNAVLGILAYLPLQPLEDLKQSYLNGLENAIVNRSPGSLECLMEYYANLVRWWTVSLRNKAGHGSPSPGLSGEKQLQKLAEHISTLVASILSAEPVSLRSTSAVISFYETLSNASADAATSTPDTHIIPIILPIPSVLYDIVITSSLSDICRTCAILAAYKHAFEAGRISMTYPREYTNRFNGYLMDVCNLLWRLRALQTSDQNASGCLFPETILPSLQSYLEAVDHDYTLPAIFGLSHHNSLCLSSKETLRNLERHAEESGSTIHIQHAGPVTTRTLQVLAQDGGLQLSWKAYRVAVLKWLEERGIGGIKQLMYVTMKDLMKASS